MSKQTIKRYKSILDSLMTFIDGNDEGEEYGKEKVYSQVELNRAMSDELEMYWNP
jgi:hypothetical protein